MEGCGTAYTLRVFAGTEVLSFVHVYEGFRFVRGVCRVCVLRMACDCLCVFVEA